LIVVVVVDVVVAVVVVVVCRCGVGVNVVLISTPPLDFCCCFHVPQIVGGENRAAYGWCWLVVFKFGVSALCMIRRAGQQQLELGPQLFLPKILLASVSGQRSARSLSSRRGL
jgi:hypothetical protein